MYDSIKVMKCSCESKFQDSKYGKNNRVHTVGGSSQMNNTYTCTVCGNKANSGRIVGRGKKGRK